MLDPLWLRMQTALDLWEAERDEVNLPPFGVSLSRIDHATSFLPSASLFFSNAIGLM